MIRTYRLLVEIDIEGDRPTLPSLPEMVAVIAGIIEDDDRQLHFDILPISIADDADPWRQKSATAQAAAHYETLSPLDPRD